MFALLFQVLIWVVIGVRAQLTYKSLNFNKHLLREPAWARHFCNRHMSVQTAHTHTHTRDCDLCKCISACSGAPCKVLNVKYLRHRGRTAWASIFGWGCYYTDRREKLWTKVCMFINFIPMISGLHNQHLTNTHAQHAARHSEALKPTWKWPNWLFTWQLTVSLFLPICFPAHMRVHLCCGNPESLSDNASAFSSRAKQLHRRMWWRDMKVRCLSHWCVVC